MQGEHAHRIWNLIYSQSCFSNINDPDTCAERRVFYRLISGVTCFSYISRLKSQMVLKNLFSCMAELAPRFYSNDAPAFFGKHVSICNNKAGACSLTHPILPVLAHGFKA